MAELNTVAELEARNAEIDARITELDAAAEGRSMTDEESVEWNALGEERTANAERAAEIAQEIEDRRATVRAAAERSENRESGAFSTQRSGVARGDDIYDLSTIARSYGDSDRSDRELVERALRSLDAAQLANPDAPDSAKDVVAGFLRADSDEEFPAVEASAVAQRMLLTGSAAYKRAFAKITSGREQAMTAEERQAADKARGLTIGSTGNYPVPYTLDPTLIRVSNGAVNPLRQISKVVSITGNTWRGVTAAAVTASYGAELTVTSDNTPTLTQPEANVEKAQAFIPFSIEAGQDWAAIQSDLAQSFADAKDELEAVAFITGAGHGSNAPEGLLTGATTTTTAGGTASFAQADLYKLLEALPARFRGRGKFLGALAQYDRVRQFDTGGGGGLWMQLAAGAGDLADGQIGTLLGKGAYESTAMATTITTGSKILVFGDFSKFLIVDRIGLDIEYIPHLFDTATGNPKGQRGMYAYWRNTSKVLHTNAFRTLVAG